MLRDRSHARRYSHAAPSRRDRLNQPGATPPPPRRSHLLVRGHSGTLAQARATSPERRGRPILSVMEEPLLGGNTHEQVVRVGSTVRRPTGSWTPGVHALLSHLEQAGFSGAPCIHGVDEEGREILDYIDGEVVHPHHRHLLESDQALAQVAATIRRFHDAVSGFSAGERFAWSERGGDPSGATEILCHNDLAPWNLLHTLD